MKTRKIMSLDEFADCKNPPAARLTFYFHHVVVDVLEEWNSEITAGTEGGYVSCLSVTTNKKGYLHYVLCNDLSVKKIIATRCKKTGQNYTGDDEMGAYIDAYTTTHELSDTLYQIDYDESRMSNFDGIESIAGEFINAVEELELEKETINCKNLRRL